MNTIYIGKRKYELLNREETKDKYPNIYRHGVVAIITARFGKTIYSVNERANGYDSAIAASH